MKEINAVPITITGAYWFVSHDKENGKIISGKEAYIRSGLTGHEYIRDDPDEGNIAIVAFDTSKYKLVPFN